MFNSINKAKLADARYEIDNNQLYNNINIYIFIKTQMLYVHKGWL